MDSDYKQKIQNLIKHTRDRMLINVFYPNPLFIQYQFSNFINEVVNICNEKTPSKESSDSKAAEPTSFFDLFLLQTRNPDFQKHITTLAEKDRPVKDVENPEALLVMSVDLRHSTFLMENSFEPNKFADFIDTVNEIIRKNTLAGC